VAEELKGKLGIEPTARAEELLVADFCRIAGSMGDDRSITRSL
jgi:hypothetical protein